MGTSEEAHHRTAACSSRSATRGASKSSRRQEGARCSRCVCIFAPPPASPPLDGDRHSSVCCFHRSRDSAAAVRPPRCVGWRTSVPSPSAEKQTCLDFSDRNPVLRCFFFQGREAQRPEPADPEQADHNEERPRLFSPSFHLCTTQIEDWPLFLREYALCSRSVKVVSIRFNSRFN